MNKELMSWSPNLRERAVEEFESFLETNRGVVGLSFKFDCYIDDMPTIEKTVKTYIREKEN